MSNRKALDTRPKASQWSFSVHPVSTAMINHLSRLPPKDVNYTTFAVLFDDTGKRYIQGYVKTSYRSRFTLLKRLIGPAIISMCARPTDVLLEIQLNNFFEFGEDERTKVFRMELASLKHQIESGLTYHQLLDTFPHICSRNPFAVMKHINAMALVNQREHWIEARELKHKQDELERKRELIREYEATFLSETMETAPTPYKERRDWEDAGSPSGLVYKVWKNWKQGKLYEPETPVNKSFIKRELERKNDRSESAKVYMSWMNGTLYTPPS